MQITLIEGRILSLFNQRRYTMTLDEVCGHPRLKGATVEEIKEAIFVLIDSGYLNFSNGESNIKFRGFGRVIRCN